MAGLAPSSYHNASGNRNTNEGEISQSSGRKGSFVFTVCLIVLYYISFPKTCSPVLCQVLFYQHWLGNWYLRNIFSFPPTYSSCSEEKCVFEGKRRIKAKVKTSLRKKNSTINLNIVNILEIKAYPSNRGSCTGWWLTWTESHRGY